MQQLLSQIKITVNPTIFVKEPESSELGRKIIKESIVLIHELGFEQFTIKKLAASIGTTEGSVYRYFENKHKILLYLVSWFWGFVEYRMVFGVSNLTNCKEQLNRVMRIIINPLENLEITNEPDVVTLHKIVIEESAKTYLTRLVDKENEEGVFVVYKRICNRIATIILSINPDYTYPNSLASMTIDGILKQLFFKEHLPSLSDSVSDEELFDFTQNLLLKTIHQER
jgi:AcrR family transcriptional regulator